jgi:hypothetical protein
MSGWAVGTRFRNHALESLGGSRIKLPSEGSQTQNCPSNILINYLLMLGMPSGLRYWRLRAAGTGQNSTIYVGRPPACSR